MLRHRNEKFDYFILFLPKVDMRSNFSFSIQSICARLPDNIVTDFVLEHFFLWPLLKSTWFESDLWHLTMADDIKAGSRVAVVSSGKDNHFEPTTLI